MADLLAQALLQLQKMLFNWRELGQQTLALACCPCQNAAADRVDPCPGCYLKGPDNIWLNLKMDAPRTIRLTIVQAWASIAPQKVAHRKGLHVMLSPALEDFKHVCGKFDPPQVRNLGLQFFGGFQSKAAQSLWDPFEDGNCRFCGACDTRQQRLFDCPVHAELRRPFQPILNWVSEHAPHWVHCTAPVVHTDEGILNLVFQTRRVAPCPPPSPLASPICLASLQLL